MYKPLLNKCATVVKPICYWKHIIGGCSVVYVLCKWFKLFSAITIESTEMFDQWNYGVSKGFAIFNLGHKYNLERNGCFELGWRTSADPIICFIFCCKRPAFLAVKIDQTLLEKVRETYQQLLIRIFFIFHCANQNNSMSMTNLSYLSRGKLLQKLFALKIRFKDVKILSEHWMDSDLWWYSAI